MLPKSVVPVLYDLQLWTDLEACTFKGELDIDIEVVQPTSSIILHVADLAIQTVNLQAGKQILPATRCEQKDETLVLEFEHGTILPPGSFVLSIHYNGILNEKLDGFYKSCYEINGVTKNMAVTTFEPSDARRFLPCWDEPAFKAKFKFKVHVPIDRMVLSNMPVKEEIVSGDTRIVQFEESVPMSTYLIAIVIGEFEYIEATTEDGVLVRVYTRHGLVNKGQFVLELILKLLPFYANYFKLPYPLPKLDVVAVPVFKAGALENYGCIVYLEEALFVDENTSSSKREEVALDTAHELAHMWFGNLVTMEWWSHLWLNEGMATWMSFMAIDFLFPEWDVWIEFNNSVVSAGFNLDSLETSHPVEFEVDENSTNDAFDAISYFKGASIMLMLQHYLGHEGMQKGLVLYMENFAYKNAKSEELWECFEIATGQPVRKLMLSWTQQTGYPLVKATLLDSRKLLLEQSRFLANGQESGGQWMIPITIRSESGETLNLVADNVSTTVSLTTNAAESGWIKVNADQAGFYRVQYENSLLQKLKTAISLQSVSYADRLGILDDNFVLCKSGKQQLSSLFSLLEAYKEESNPTVLLKLIQVTIAVSKVVKAAVPRLALQVNTHICSILESPARQIGWDPLPNDSLQLCKVRESILHALVSLDHQETLTEASQRFENKSIPTDCMKAVLLGAMKNASYEALLDFYRGSSNIEERVKILDVIAGSSNPELVAQALEFSLTDEVSPQDVSNVFHGLDEQGSLLAWNWFKEHWDDVHQKLGQGFMLNRLLRATTKRIWSTDMAEDVKEFCGPRFKSQKLVDECCEDIYLRAQWLSNTAQDAPQIESILLAKE